jgi:hypothetical protein
MKLLYYFILSVFILTNCFLFNQVKFNSNHHIGYSNGNIPPNYNNFFQISDLNHSPGQLNPTGFNLTNSSSEISGFGYENSISNRRSKTFIVRFLEWLQAQTMNRSGLLVWIIPSLIAHALILDSALPFFISRISQYMLPFYVLLSIGNNDLFMTISPFSWFSKFEILKWNELFNNYRKNRINSSILFFLTSMRNVLSARFSSLITAHLYQDYWLIETYSFQVYWSQKVSSLFVQACYRWSP